MKVQIQNFPFSGTNRTEDRDRFVFPFHEIFKTIGLGCSIFLVKQNAKCDILVINTKCDFSYLNGHEIKYCIVNFSSGSNNWKGHMLSHMYTKYHCELFKRRQCSFFICSLPLILFQH